LKFLAQNLRPIPPPNVEQTTWSNLKNGEAKNLGRRFTPESPP
jgi:hypothetical protein